MLIFMFGAFIGAIALVGTLMYIIIMGPSRYHRDGVVGKLHRLLTSVPLNVCGLCVSCLFGCNQRKGRLCCSRCVKHTLHERNWFMVIFYIALVWTVEALYLLVSLPRLKASIVSKTVSWGLVALSELLWVCATFTDPGTVTAEAEMEAQRRQFSTRPATDSKKRLLPRKQAKRGVGIPGQGTTPVNPKAHRPFLFSPAEEFVLNHRYVVDGMVYAMAPDEVTAQRTAAQKEYVSPAVGQRVHLGQNCITCHVPRPSRSKHCRLCHRCVRRYDHHCPWINNDVAEQTMRHFLGFLLCHAISCTWACLDLFRCIRQFLMAHHAWGWVLRYPNGHTVSLSLSQYAVILINFHMLEACLFFFAVFIGLVLYGFWGYQMTFAMANLTVNDLNKIDDTVEFVVTLPTLDLVYREARKVRERLEQVAERKPKALLALTEPPPPKTEPGYEEGREKNQAYRKRVKKMLASDLKGLYDRGVWLNLMEILFPSAPLRDSAVLAKAMVYVQ
ncbi:palmitoyl acyltransferase 5, putative [Leishmania panamensis]|uniref:Palmitoyltransferase n=1 Tax=Leishmania panamensis TaxID=5679 RepID=A0A088S3B3_LEIPA|nr:palmitoyl acyltransferase 5, putative [Leishmania panamensis]AIN95981.1 palmitoyl acyltransferase 5, putative [Leishmania panamensis]